ncbi:MAG TPA: methionyl-tRNA formyltransferase [Candidatus Brocadiia bacterium]|nr:methionyl-tRNA formyltransferase [Planctomycetota bacterium]MDO8092293.1 methionyl-tRNA formyltransferase [Candidatus Brocadiales bacterium]
MNIVFLGTSDFAVPSLRSLAASKHKILAVVTQPDRPKGRSSQPCPSPVKAVADEYGLRVIQPENVNHPETVLLLEETRPDIIIVVAYGQKLSQQILSIPKYQCINIHASLLPRYRGAAPVNWAIINGEDVTGVSIIIMGERMDTGDIIAQRSLSIYPHETAGELEKRLAPLGAEVLLFVLEQLEKGTVISKAQDDANATYAKKLKKEDGRINWNQDAKRIHNFVRGMTPRPCAYTYLSKADKKIRIIILKTEIGTVWHGQTCLSVKPQPGDVIDISAKGINVAAIDTAGADFVPSILITMLQPEGRRLMSAAEFIRGHSIKVGDHFNSIP